MHKLKKLNLLIFDVNKVFLDHLSVFLDNEDTYQIKSTFSSEAALLNFDNFQDIDVVIMAIDVLEISNYASICKFLEEKQNVKVVAISNYDQPEFLAQVKAKGFKACVSKDEIYANLKDTIALVLKAQ